MKITWFSEGIPKDSTDVKEDRESVNGWVKDHSKELHDVYHLAQENEIEALKIISGNQEIDKEGRITLHTLELHFMRDLVLVLRVVEVQDSGSYTTNRTATQLGYISIPHCRDDCNCARPVTAKEIK